MTSQKGVINCVLNVDKSRSVGNEPEELYAKSVTYPRSQGQGFRGTHVEKITINNYRYTPHDFLDVLSLFCFYLTTSVKPKITQAIQSFKYSIENSY